MKRSFYRLSLVTVFALLMMFVAGLVPAMAAVTPGGSQSAGIGASAEVTPTVGSEVEIKGIVSAVGGGSLTVSGTVVTTDANTKYKPNAAAVVMGAFVEVDGILQADNSILAKEVNVEKPETEEIEVKGVIESFGATQWVVGGKTITVDANTKIKGTPVVGRRAEVKVSKQADGSLLALKIEVDASKSKARRFGFSGIIKAVGATQWTVGSRTIQITPATKIRGTPQVGRLAVIQGFRDGTTFSAMTIRVGRMMPSKALKHR